ncbi:MAG: hypothetical protein RL616_557 [Verrucomicrobiota bacterium]
MKLKSNFLALLAVTIACSLLQSASAAGGKSSTTPDTSTSASNKPVAGGGGKSTAPAPAPARPVLTSGPITFTASGPVNGSTPVCTGDFRIQAYYPTLLDESVNVSVSSLDVPDGTVLYVNTVNTGYSYPYTANSFVVTGGAGICTEKIFVGVGVAFAGVTITDASGAIIFAGN